MWSGFTGGLVLLGVYSLLAACSFSDPVPLESRELSQETTTVVADLGWLVPSTSTSVDLPEDATPTENPPVATLETVDVTVPLDDSQVSQSILDELASLAREPRSTAEAPAIVAPPQTTVAPDTETIERVDPNALRDSFTSGESGPSSSSPSSGSQTMTFSTPSGMTVTYRFVDQSVFPGPHDGWEAEIVGSGTKVSLDSNADGSSDIVVSDFDGDGIFDLREEDRNFDSLADFRCLNHDLDSGCEELWVDTNFDGDFDKNTFDTDNDGIAEEQDLSVFVPEWTIVRCDDLDGDEAEDVCHLDWDGDGIADSSEEMVVYWPPDAKEPSISFKTAVQLIAPPASFSGSR